MAGFPYQHHLSYAPDSPFFFPFDHLPPPSPLQREAGNTTIGSSLSCFQSCCPNNLDAALSDALLSDINSKANAGTSSISASPIYAHTPESSSSFDSDMKVSLADGCKISTTTSSSTPRGDRAEPKSMLSCLRKKRKDGQRCNSESVQSKETEAGKSRGKLRRRSGAAKKEEDKKTDAHPVPTGYIHVRARRGEATDSHSLAERARRERIRERMKMLQDLVPGCDKVVGKALLLEEIINYIQSLQNQVEFLSMKLAAADRFDFGFLFDEDMNAKTEKWEKMTSQGSPKVQITGHVQATTTAADGHNPCLPLPHDDQGLHPGACFAFEGPPPHQENIDYNLVMHAGDDHRQSFLLDQIELAMLALQ